MVPGLDGKPVRIFGDLLLKTIRNRLLDVLFQKGDKGACSMDTFGPNSLLLPWEISNRRVAITHFRLLNFLVRFRGLVGPVRGEQTDRVFHRNNMAGQRVRPAACSSRDPFAVASAMTSQAD